MPFKKEKIMKVTQYVTSPNVNFRKYDSKPIPNFMGRATGLR